MYINQVFELSMVLDHEKFDRILRMAYNYGNFLEGDKDELIDSTMASKGITVIYRNTQYKKKIRVVANAYLLTDGTVNPDKLTRKLGKQIAEYFHQKYHLDDFILSGMNLVADIDVGDQSTASAYLKVIQRVGKVKGFSPVTYDCFDDSASFCLSGNSNGIDFLIYDLGQIIRGQYSGKDSSHKRMKNFKRHPEGILRAEVRLTAPKAIRNYTAAANCSGQAVDLSRDCQRVFLDTFVKIVPYGDFYKKEKAMEIIHREVSDSVVKRRMLRLISLIPEKKSVYLAQKAMNCRNIEKVMAAFAKINLSPVTISKRHHVKHLKGICAYLLDGE